jgi:7-carboxy-7-deazaguanine synthase
MTFTPVLNINAAGHTGLSSKIATPTGSAATAPTGLLMGNSSSQGSIALIDQTSDQPSDRDRQSGTGATFLPIVEMFHSIQGEGAWAGTNAFFIRLAGCDVGCSWCDTKQSWNAKQHPLRAIEDLVVAAQVVNPRLVVITGGEPLMHNLTELTDALHSAGLHVCLETSGAHPMSGTFDWVTLSPKRHRPPHGSVVAQARELKVVIQDTADLQWAEAQAAQVDRNTLKFLQAEWNTPASQDLVFNYVLAHPEWLISIQTHKYLDIR